MSCHHTGYFGHRASFLGVVLGEEEAQQKRPIVQTVGTVNVLRERVFNAGAEMWSTPRYEYLGRTGSHTS